MQAEEAEDAVHHIGDSGHVAAVFNEGYQGEHDGDEGHEADHAADTGDDAVADEGLEQAVIHMIAKLGSHPGEEILKPFLRIGAQVEGDHEHEVENADHDERAEEPVGEDFVQTVRESQTILAGVLFDDALGEQAADIAVAGVGNH